MVQTYSAVVGREAELIRLHQVIDAADSGRASALVITGAHGVGKTELCLAAMSVRDPSRIHRLLVACPPTETLATELAPVRTGLRRTSVPPALTRTCLSRMDAGDPIRAIDEWVDEVTADSTLVVVVDDLQWADGSLRDLIAYLLAGPADRRLAILITATVSGLAEGDPLHRWLTDALRIHQVARLRLIGLSRAATETQLGNLLGSRPHQSLVDEVHAAGGGNPYFTQLLAQGLSPSDRHVPSDTPPDLVSAVMGRWHGCGSPTRFLTCLLAVAATPLTAIDLAELTADLDHLVEVEPALFEAQNAGLVVADDDGRYWFRHPLQAEIIQRPVLVEDQHMWHAALARLGERRFAGREPTVQEAVDQAIRHDRAGSAAVAYAWAMRAYELGSAPTADRKEPGPAGLRRVLRRAIELRPTVAGAAESLSELWRRQRGLAADAGAYAEELEAVEALIALTGAERHPLELSELLVRRMLLRASLAVAFLSVEEMERAVELARAEPSSWQLALAEAELAHAAFWRGDARAAELAPVALDDARVAGHPGALSLALTVNAILAIDDNPRQAQRLAAEGVAAAVAARDWWAYVHAVMWESNAQSDAYGPGEAAYLDQRRLELIALDAPMTYIVQIAAVEADTRLEAGDWQRCQQLMREVVVCDPGPFADMRVRVCLARLAAYRGRADEALAHVERARELMARQAVFANLDLDVTWVTALLAAGRAREAYEAAVAAAEAEGIPVNLAERLLPLAARGLADLAEAERDRDQDPAEVLMLLDGLRTRFPTVLDCGLSSSTIGRARLAAMQDWYAVEAARARREDEPAGWAALRIACGPARLPWLEVYACWRAAEGYLGLGAPGRAEGTRQLRAGYELGRRLGTESLLAEFENLAQLAQLRLVPAEQRLEVDASLLRGLTPREREVLDLLCHGLTYADIASTLVISEKTVSSHVSNLLRKTKTTNRVELAQLAGRVARAAGS